MRRYSLFVLFLFYIIVFLTFNNVSLTKKVSEEQASKEQELQEMENRVTAIREEYENLQIAFNEYETKLYGVGGSSSFPEELISSDFVFPIAEEDFIRYTSPFGLRQDPFFDIQMHHRGVDIATIWRAQVVSVADGIVIEHYPPPGFTQGNVVFRGHDIFGGMIKIDHGDFETLYAHFSETNVRTGQSVLAGELIGRVGDTGRARGQHLHLEMFIDGENVNPLLYLSELEYEY